MRKARASVLGVIVLGSLFLAAGCAKPPEQDILAAGDALKAAKDAEAGEYAADSLAAAESAKANLDAEIKAQEEKFSLFRSYDKSKELAAAAKSAADKAASDAAAGKQQARQEAMDMLAEARTAIEEVRAMLETAPRGKGSQADIAAMTSDLAGIEGSLADVDAALAAERYHEAKAKAEAAKQSTEQIRGEIMQAMEAVKAARSRR